MIGIKFKSGGGQVVVMWIGRLASALTSTITIVNNFRYKIIGKIGQHGFVHNDWLRDAVNT
jgi:hypothetical protein